MPRITVEISETVSELQRHDPRFQKLLKESEIFFNCRKSCCFSEHAKLMLGLHEGAHAYFAKKSGASDIKFHGPTMYWDSRPQYDKPAISKSRTIWDVPVGGSVVDIIKSFIAGYVCRREMSDSPNDEIAIEMDIDGCREWFDHHVGTGDAGFAVALEDAESAILEDLKFPSVRQEVWAEAGWFIREIFPAPKLTSSLLRARRLG